MSRKITNSEPETKVSLAWIITIESFNRYKDKHDQVLSVLKWQTSSNQINRHITQLFVDKILWPRDQIAFLRKPYRDFFPYKAHWSQNNKCTIGHDPELFARQVKNLQVLGEDGVRGKLIWQEL